MVNWEFFDNQTPESARNLVDTLRAGEQVTSTRGRRLCTFRETERILAGYATHSNDHTIGAPTLAGLHVAHQEHMTAHGVEGED